MSAILFEANCVPRPSLADRGLLLLAGFLALGSLITGGLFLVLGAWPVLGFTGTEAALVIGLLLLHRRRALRRREQVTLTSEGQLIIRRRDHRGRPQELHLNPYWARPRLESRPGRTSALLLQQRGLAVEIGALLGEEQKQSLAQALTTALRNYREPVFDNPQLR